jgi:holo-[acyl-carrier protein] synthase
MATGRVDKRRGLAKLEEFCFQESLPTMILGIGTDICGVARLRKSIERTGERFVQRLFTEGEIAYCEPKARKYEHFAGRFAAKEAILKAFGTGATKDARFQDIEIVNDERGKPVVRLSGVTKQLAQRMGVAHIHISIAHVEEFATATAIFERGD